MFFPYYHKMLMLWRHNEFWKAQHILDVLWRLNDHLKCMYLCIYGDCSKLLKISMKPVEFWIGFLLFFIIYYLSGLTLLILDYIIYIHVLVCNNATGFLRYFNMPQETLPWFIDYYKQDYFALKGYKKAAHIVLDDCKMQ